MAKEKREWEEDTAILAAEEKNAPPANAPGPLAGKASVPSTLRGSALNQYSDDAQQGQKETANRDTGENQPGPAEGTSV